MSDAHAPPPSLPLYTQRSWSSDACRDETWLRRKCNLKKKLRNKSVTDDDVDELKGCIELGFGFESSPEVELDHRLSLTLPAPGLYHAVNMPYNDSLVSNFVVIAAMPPPPVSDSDSMPSPVGSPHTAIFGRGDSPQRVKTRMKQWAQVVACAVRQSS